jgi:hypothetical protein
MGRPGPPKRLGPRKPREGTGGKLKPPAAAGEGKRDVDAVAQQQSAQPGSQTYSRCGTHQQGLALSWQLQPVGSTLHARVCCSLLAVACQLLQLPLYCSGSCSCCPCKAGVLDSCIHCLLCSSSLRKQPHQVRGAGVQHAHPSPPWPTPKVLEATPLLLPPPPHPQTQSATQLFSQQPHLSCSCWRGLLQPVTGFGWVGCWLHWHPQGLHRSMQ